MAKRTGWDEPWKSPDPYEDFVFKCLENGCTLDQIDKALNCPKGTAKTIAVYKWKRDKQEHDMKARRKGWS